MNAKFVQSLLMGWFVCFVQDISTTSFFFSMAVSSFFFFFSAVITVAVDHQNDVYALNVVFCLPVLF